MLNLYCVLKIKDKQYFVTEGDVIKTHPVTKEDLIEVLLLKDGESMFLGDPVVEKGGVVIDLIGTNHEKTDVRRFRSKSRYRKNKSHSQDFSILKVVKIGSKITGVKVNIIEETDKNTEIIKDKTAVKAVEKSIMSLESLGFSTRILGALNKNKIKTISQLSKLNKEEIIALEGLGKKSAEDILKKLGK